MRLKSWKPWDLLSPALSAVFLLLVIPICFIVVYSFWLRSPTGADVTAFQFSNCAKFFVDYFYPSILLRTIRVSLESVTLCLVIGYIPAYFFYSSETRFKSILKYPFVAYASGNSMMKRTRCVYSRLAWHINQVSLFNFRANS